MTQPDLPTVLPDLGSVVALLVAAAVIWVLVVWPWGNRKTDCDA